MRLYPRIFSTALVSLGAMHAGMAHADWIVDPGGDQTAGTGDLLISCTNAIVRGHMDVAAGGLLQVQHMQIEAGGVLDGGSGLIDVNGNWTNQGTFNPGTGRVQISTRCGISTSTFTGTNTFNQLDLAPATGSPLTIVLPATALGTTTVNTALTFGDNGTPVSITGPACTGILLGPNAPAPVMGNVTLGPQIWIAKQAPKECAAGNGNGDPDGGNNGGTTARAIPSLGTGALALLTLALGAAAAGLRRRPPRDAK